MRDNTRKPNFKKSNQQFNKPQQKTFNKFNKDNKKDKPVAKSTVVKKLALKHTDATKLPKKRMYRLNILIGSSVVCDTFVVDVDIMNSMVAFRDKLSKAYDDLLKLLNPLVANGMLPKPFKGELPISDDDIMSMPRKDIIHNLVSDMYQPDEKSSGLNLPSIVRYKIKPGAKVKDVSKRIIIGLNFVPEANFTPKKAESKSKQPAKASMAKAPAKRVSKKK